MAETLQIMEGFSLYARHYVEKGRARAFWRTSPHIRVWIEESLQDGEVFWDVGACIGQFALYAATLHKDMEIYAVEPYWANYLGMCHNIELNGQGDHVLPMNLALWDKGIGRTRLFIRDLRMGGAGHQVGWPPLTGTGVQFYPVGYSWVVATSLDSLVYTLGCACPNHIKIDVDGTEYRIVAGMARVLRDPQLRSLVVERNSTRPGNEHTLETIEAYGFTTNNPWNDEEAADAIFVRE